jgi:predicted unusual protein kinase regulating ubiquinone biosynthesis (AarF/ABC1/UbiB family)
MLRSRYRRITFFFARILISLAFWELILPWLGLRKISSRNRSERLQHIAIRYRAMAIQMGGVLIKVGQFLSSRVDVLPREITSELAGLQDEVPAERFDDVRRVAETEFGMPLEEKYFEFNEKPLAAASLGQVHQARLRIRVLASERTKQTDGLDGNESIEILDVVVKIQRPNIQKIIATDMAALHKVGDWLSHYPPLRKRADIPALLIEFERTLYEEIDYLAEGRNAETFAANFEGQTDVLVPRVVWTHTTQRVLTLEDVQGIKITDYDAITAAGIDRAEVAARLLDTYLQQIFEDGFFHADPHPGNLFVRTLPIHSGQEERKSRWQLTFVDFGMVGRVPQQTREGMRELLIAVGTRNAARVVKAYQMLDVLLPGADLALLEKAEEVAFDRFWGKNMTELQHVSVQEMTDFAQQFRQLIYDLPFQVPQDIIFLVRAVGILSGMCTGLDPGFNLWQHLVSFSQKLITEEAKDTRADWFEGLKDVARRAFALPFRLDAMLSKVERGELVVKDPQLAAQLKRIEMILLRGIGGMVFIAMLVSSVQLHLASESVLAGIFGIGAILTLIWIIFRGHE